MAEDMKITPPYLRYIVLAVGDCTPAGKVSHNSFVTLAVYDILGPSKLAERKSQ
jgi:hypothetical protein